MMYTKVCLCANGTHTDAEQWTFVVDVSREDSILSVIRSTYHYLPAQAHLVLCERHHDAIRLP